MSSLKYDGDTRNDGWLLSSLTWDRTRGITVECTPDARGMFDDVPVLKLWERGHVRDSFFALAPFLRLLQRARLSQYLLSMKEATTMSE